MVEALLALLFVDSFDFCCCSDVCFERFVGQGICPYDSGGFANDTLRIYRPFGNNFLRRMLLKLFWNKKTPPIKSVVFLDCFSLLGGDYLSTMKATSPSPNSSVLAPDTAVSSARIATAKTCSAI